MPPTARITVVGSSMPAPWTRRSKIVGTDAVPPMVKLLPMNSTFVSARAAPASNSATATAIEVNLNMPDWAESCGFRLCGTAAAEHQDTNAACNHQCRSRFRHHFDLHHSEVGKVIGMVVGRC